MTAHPDLVHYGEPVVPPALTPAEVVRLLVVALAHDGRHDPADELAQAGWSDVADRAGWTVAEAEEAIRAHYVESDAYITPAAITRLIRARRAVVDREREKAERRAWLARHQEATASNLRPERAELRAHLRAQLRAHLHRTSPTLTTEEPA